jgi:hypothetical protein
LHAASPVQKEELNNLTQSIIGAALEVHRELGPGLLEQAYEACLAFELLSRGPVGLLFNFNVKWLTEHGLRRVVNGFPE